jgi:hypothetical protein
MKNIFRQSKWIPISRVVICGLLFASTSVFADGNGLNQVGDAYINEATKNGDPIFYSGCKTPTGQAVILFRLSKNSGIIFEINGDNVTEDAKLILNDGNILFDGTTSSSVTPALVVNKKELLKFPFTMLMPHETQNILHQKFEKNCDGTVGEPISTQTTANQCGDNACAQDTNTQDKAQSSAATNPASSPVASDANGRPLSIIVNGIVTPIYYDKDGNAHSAPQDH